MHKLTAFDINKMFNQHVPEYMIKNIEMMIKAYNEAKDTDHIVEVIRADGELGLVEVQKDPNIDYGMSPNKVFSKKEYFLRIVAACPQGLMKTMRISTNYLQLKTIYKQRRHHKLPEWQMFCDWIESLPCADLITGEKRRTNWIKVLEQYR